VWGTDDIRDHIKFYSVWRPDVLIASPSYYRALLWFSEEDNAKFSFKKAVSSGELLDDATRKRICDTFQADVIDTYGLMEVGIVSWECPAHLGYHVNAESVLVEFIDDEGPVKSGRTGRVYVTSLDRRVNPMIRYFSGDVATPTDEECPCGRGLPLMKNVQGRIVDFILTEEGRHVSPWMVIRYLRSINGVENFKLIQKRDFSIEIYFRTKGTDAEAAYTTFHRRCAELFGGLPLRVKMVDEIEGERGPKFRPVESHLTH
jgi:phenylacetate-CoA ligase